MASRHQQEKKIAFKTIILFKDQTLGIGSYGAVCKAKCDDLLCAAKIIHPTLFDPNAVQQVAPHREHRLPIRRFEQECEFLSTVRHPNIVQYLGTHQDPETRLPVLLMELMDDSLTLFLESSTQLIPYHIQVNICHDITLALSFLHSNNIVHRDLSSNNVLLRGDVLAKVTDFGMARLGDIKPQATRFTNTMCPGTDVYMPPEAVQDKPVYTEKIDCFSFGVITVQTLTREFPKPGDRMMTVHDPHYPRPLKMSVPEIERRQNHISQVDPNHPLLPIALDCLKDADGERPSAQQLCERVAALKETAKYKNANERVKDSSGKDGECEQIQSLQQDLEARNQIIAQKDAIIAEKEQQLRQSREENQQKNLQIQQKDEQINQLERDGEYELIQNLQQTLEAKNRVIGQKDATIAEKEQQLRHRREENQQQNEQIRQLERDENQTIQRLEREKNQAIQEKERQLRRVNQQLEESERLVADFGKRNTELEEQLRVMREQTQEQGGGDRVNRTSIKLRWREGKKTPCEMGRFCDAVVNNNTVFCKYSAKNQLYVYHIPSSNWYPLPDCPQRGACAIAVVDGLLTAIGGYGKDFWRINKLFSLTGEGSGRRWTEEFPPMPTKCDYVGALCTGTALIVAGGRDDDLQELKTVEVLNIETRQWHSAADLPEPLLSPSLTLCGDLVYIVGVPNVKATEYYPMYSCHLSLLLSSAGFKSGLIRNIFTGLSKRIISWTRIPDLPVKGSTSTAVSLHGQLLAIGGRDSEDKPTTAVRMYQPSTNSWEVISHMTTPRIGCLAAVLPDNQLMVVGGWTSGGKLCDSVKFGTII